MTSIRTIPSDKINLRLILVSGKTKEFLFSPNDSAGDIAQFVFDNWPEDWSEEAVAKADILRLIYQGRFLHSNVTLGALGLVCSKTTVMHLVPRENLPEPNSQGQNVATESGHFMWNDDLSLTQTEMDTFYPDGPPSVSFSDPDQTPTVNLSTNPSPNVDSSATPNTVSNINQELALPNVDHLTINLLATPNVNPSTSLNEDSALIPSAINPNSNSPVININEDSTVPNVDHLTRYHDADVITIPNVNPSTNMNVNSPTLPNTHSTIPVALINQESTFVSNVNDHTTNYDVLAISNVDSISFNNPVEPLNDSPSVIQLVDLTSLAAAATAATLSDISSPDIASQSPENAQPTSQSLANAQPTSQSLANAQPTSQSPANAQPTSQSLPIVQPPGTNTSISDALCNRVPTPVPSLSTIEVQSNAFPTDSLSASPWDNFLDGYAADSSSRIEQNLSTITNITSDLSSSSTFSNISTPPYTPWVPFTNQSIDLDMSPAATNLTSTSIIAEQLEPLTFSNTPLEVSPRESVNPTETGTTIVTEVLTETISIPLDSVIPQMLNSPDANTISQTPPTPTANTLENTRETSSPNSENSTRHSNSSAPTPNENIPDPSGTTPTPRPTS